MRNVQPIMGRPLYATIPIKGVDPNDLSVKYENQTMKGFADVGIFARGTEKTANQRRVVVEIKKWLRGARAYRPQDQLIAEMEASRQAQARGNNNTTKAEKFVRGCLTDMFALNIASAYTTDSSVVFYMAQRVCAHRSYLLRLRFILCENVSRSDLEPFVVETPVAVPTTKKCCSPSCASSKRGFCPQTGAHYVTRNSIANEIPLQWLPCLDCARMKKAGSKSIEKT